MGIPDEEREVDLVDDAPPLPDRTSDAEYRYEDSAGYRYEDGGWATTSTRSSNDDRLLEDRPPHWG